MKRVGSRPAWILFAAGLVLCAFLIVLLFYQRKGKSQDDKEGEGAGFSVVQQGIAIDIPVDYFCYPYEDWGLLIYNEKDCSLLLRLTMEPFEELKLNKDDLPDQAEKKGYVCLAGIKEIQIRGKEYLYFIIEYNGVSQYVIYTAAGTEHSAHVVLDAGERSEQEALEVAASILESARDTDQKDTDIYDFYFYQTKPQERSYVSRALILNEQGKELASYGIPEGFYMDTEAGVYEEKVGYEQNYIWLDTEKNVLEGTNIYVTVSVKPQETASVKEMIDRKRKFWDLSITAVRQAELNGYTVYYMGNSQAKTEQEETVVLYEFYAVIELEDGNLYQLEAWAYGHSSAMELETYEDFFIIERKQDSKNESFNYEMYKKANLSLDI